MVQSHFSQVEIITTRVIQHWKTLFSLRYEDRAKSILHKLKKGKSVTVTNNVFLKACSVISIEAKEIQQEVKVVLKDSNLSYHEMLERIHANY